MLPLVLLLQGVLNVDMTPWVLLPPLSLEGTLHSLLNCCYCS